MNGLESQAEAELFTINNLDTLLKFLGGQPGSIIDATQLAKLGAKKWQE